MQGIGKKLSGLLLAVLLALTLSAPAWADGTRDGKIHINIPLPVPTSGGEEGDQLGVIVYQGRVYYQMVAPTLSQNYLDREALQGEYLGVADRIGRYAPLFQRDNPPSLETFYREHPLMASHDYRVYTVKGYDSRFRLMVPFYEGPVFFECIGTGWFGTGQDLLDQAGVLGNIRLAENPVAGQDTSTVLGVPAEELERFVQALYRAPVTVPTQERRMELMSGNSTFLYLILNDGTCVTLRLFEGGVVACQGLFFQMEGMEFARIYGQLPLFNPYL